MNEIVLLQQEMYIIAAFSDCPGAATLDSDVPAPKLLKSLWVCMCQELWYSIFRIIANIYVFI